MSVKLRLRRMGSTNRPFYRVVAIDSRNRRDGRAIEELGWYDPLHKPMVLKLEEEPILEWLRRGAEPSPTVRELMRERGILLKWELLRKGVPAEQATQQVAAMLENTKDIHCLRDATRGGLAAVLNELAQSSNVGVEFDEPKVPVRQEVMAACEMLGLDPLFIANEGKLVALLPEQYAESTLEVMRAHPFGKDATIIGRVVERHPGLVLAKTSIGGSRVVDLPAGELLPRIC